MDEGEISDRIGTFGVGQNLHPRSVNYYLNFSKTRSKLGPLATTGYFQVKDFLVKEIPLPSARHIAKSIENLVRKNHPSVSFLRSRHTEESAPKSKEELGTLVRKSNEVLAEATTVFPFTLFPDTITLDRKKLVLTQRTFFMTGRVLTIQIEEILNITVNLGPFFGGLHIAIRGLTSEDHFDISYLKRRDAIHLKHMIEGYIIAVKDKIDTEHLSKEEAIKVLAELGHDSNPDQKIS